MDWIHYWTTPRSAEQTQSGVQHRFSRTPHTTPWLVALLRPRIKVLSYTWFHFNNSVDFVFANSILFHITHFYKLITCLFHDWITRYVSPTTRMYTRISLTFFKISAQINKCWLLTKTSPPPSVLSPPRVAWSYTVLAECTPTQIWYNCELLVLDAPTSLLQLSLLLNRDWINFIKLRK